MNYTREEVEDLTMETWNSGYLCAEGDYKKDIKVLIILFLSFNTIIGLIAGTLFWMVS